ncbi:MAG: MarR family transcriptional regulator [Clostridia bacterium]|jgi:DNA-binding MarR family transcriptional regulator|nr:MarR family transcriptional regulator [Clostridia bacterium]
MNKHYGGTLISQIKQLQDRVFNKILKEEGIYEFNGQQGRILFSLWKDEKLSLIELSKRTSLAKTTLSAMIDRMRKNGLVIVEESKEDKRNLVIYLSDKTLALEDKINNATKRITDIFYKDFSEKEAKELDRLLIKIKENLKNE